MAYTLGLELSTSGTNFTGSVLDDELRMISTMDVRADDDIVYITLKENKLDVDSQGHATAPKFTQLDITEAEYREFVSSFGFYMNYLKKYLNNVYFKNGLKFPYNPDEIYTTVDFKPQSMHIFLDL